MSTYTRLVESIEAEDEAPVEYFISAAVDGAIVKVFIIVGILGAFYMGGQIIRAFIQG